jgi:hypothetical protein
MEHFNKLTPAQAERLALLLEEMPDSFLQKVVMIYLLAIRR